MSQRPERYTITRPTEEASAITVDEILYSKPMTVEDMACAMQPTMRTSVETIQNTSKRGERAS
jgi:hypothetical protein